MVFCLEYLAEDLEIVMEWSQSKQWKESDRISESILATNNGGVHEVTLVGISGWTLEKLLEESLEKFQETTSEEYI